MLTVKLMAQKMAEVVRSTWSAIWMVFERDVEQAEWIAENIASVIKTYCSDKCAERGAAAKIGVGGAG